MADKKLQAQTPMPLSIRVSLQDIYDRLCPPCRERMIEVITGQADKAVLHMALKNQFEAKSDGA